MFFSDFDNTLIYSYRKKIDEQKVLVEKLNGKEQSYMTDYTYSFFQNVDWLSLVPVTMRSEIQYRRLLFHESLHIRYALICNGGKLLIDNSEDSEWSENTLKLVREELPDLEELGKWLGDLCENEVQTPESYYYYAKTDEPKNICEALKRKNHKGNIQIEYDHRKVYLFPHNINKGSAIRRFVERYEVKTSVGAGDSRIDVPMLNEVDYPMLPEGISGLLFNQDVIKLRGEIVSDQICSELKTMHLKGVL